MQTLSIVAIAMLLASSFFGLHDRPSDGETVTLVAIVPAADFGSEIYLASNANNWNPGDPEWKLRAGPADDPGRYSIELPRSAIPASGLRFKFTKGSWETVELDNDLRDIPNRVLTLADINREGASSVFRVVVPAFANRHEGTQRRSTVVGTLEVFDFTSESLGNTRKVRVWLPEAYHADPGRRFPVLYMHDGQNCFDEATSAFGNEWRIDETLTELVASGEVPPMIVVGIDNAGAMRSWEYNASYTAFGNRQPYGEKYVAMLVDELMPEIAERYRVRSGPANTALGGSSFGGNITMLAAMERPGVFGSLLIESPAVPIVGPKFQEAILEFGAENRWTPATADFTGRVFLAMGTQETANDDYNARLVKLMDEIAPAFAREVHRVVIEEGAAHNEAAWANRFPDAARFLFGVESDE